MSLLSKIAERIHKNAEVKGFWGPPEYLDKICAKLALVHSEVTEVLEALRKNKGAEAVTDECADIIIRLLDIHYKLAEDGYATADLWAAVDNKMTVNEARPPLHGHAWG